jgi:DNA-directed RNA polymerase subunit K/omega
MTSSAVFDDASKVFAGDTSTYMSMPFMTKYEFDQIIGLRTVHISRGAPMMVDMPADFKIQTNMELRHVAIKELVEHKLPYIVKRTMPNGKTEYWPVAKLGLQRVRELLRNA